MGPGAEGDQCHDVQRAAREAPDLSFKGAYPVKWTGPSFNAAQNTVVTEVIEIAHEGIQVSLMAPPSQYTKAQLQIEGSAPLDVLFNPTEY